MKILDMEIGTCMLVTLQYRFFVTPGGGSFHHSTWSRLTELMQWGENVVIALCRPHQQVQTRVHLHTALVGGQCDWLSVKKRSIPSATNGWRHPSPLEPGWTISPTISSMAAKVFVVGKIAEAVLSVSL